MENAQDFTQGSIFKKILRFMLPILFSLILQAMYSAVDLLVVGRFGTTAGISAVATGANITHTFTFVAAAFCTGVTVLIGRYIGAKQTERLSPLIGGAVAFFALVSVALTAVLVLFARPIAVLMQAPEEAVDLTAQYIRICGAGFVFITFYNFISGIFRGMGNAKLPLLFVGIACVVNIFGDLLLVAVFHMNVAGAAIATVAAQAVSVVLSLIIIRRQNLPFKLKLKNIRLNSEVGLFARIGAPLAMQELLTQISFLALCAFVNRLGLAASSGYGVAQRIVSFILLIPSSLSQTIAPFVSQNVGARQDKRAVTGTLCGMALGAAIGVAVGLLTFFKGDMLSQLFSSDQEVVAKAFEYLRGFAPETVVTSILFSFLGFYNGYAKSLFVMVQGLIQSFVIRLPMAYFMSIRPDASLTGIGLAAPTATVFGIAMCVWYYRTKLRKEIAQKQL